LIQTNTLGKIKLGDWGYIYRTLKKGIIRGDSDIRKYDLFLVVIITGSVTGLISFILAVIDIEKFKKTKWKSACSVSFLNEV
jgi:hypothetical protein